jgi:uncharacterized NAD-dependent epimerase/dehydratase family protein
MKKTIDGKALVYADGAFTTPNGKTAHGLVRFTERYEIIGLIDHVFAGQDAGEVLDGKNSNIPIFANLQSAVDTLSLTGENVTLVMGLAPDGGRLPAEAKNTIKMALQCGMNVDSGLHDFLYKDEDLMAIAKENGCRVRDIRRTPDRDQLHFFTGKIEEVNCLKIAVLGTDSAIGKRTTSWIIVHALRAAGIKAEMVGTGQTAWMQGAKYSMIMDSCINDFVSGEIEHAVYEAWKNESPDVILIEGQGSLMNPAYPGGFEILAAGRPDFVILQHAPRRIEYDGFPGYSLHPLEEQIAAIETISHKKVLAITINHENMHKDEIGIECDRIASETGLVTTDVLHSGAEKLVEFICKKLNPNIS